MTATIRNIIVIGGSYVGRGTAQKLAQNLPASHRVLLIEPHTHFHHIFTFPRFAVIPGYEHKAFIPYSATFASTERPSAHAIVQARVVSVQARSLTLDRQWRGSNQIDFNYLVIATGSTLTQPTGLSFDAKSPSISYLRDHQQRVQKADSILVVGGGAAGVQMAADLKQYFPNKEIVLAHSRTQLMPKFHPALHELIKKRFDELGVKIITGARVIVPEGGFEAQKTSPFDVKFTDGRTVRTDFAILATGQRPNNTILQGLNESSHGQILNPENGFVRVRPTLQLSSPEHDHMFAVGDIADTGAHKAARPGAAQADAVAANIHAMIQGLPPSQTFSPAPAAIHLTLGLQNNVIFRNPDTAKGVTEPTIIEKDDGQEDMNVDSIWQRHGIQIHSPNDYHL